MKTTTTTTRKLNRTGVQTAPKLTKELIGSVAEGEPSMNGGPDAIADVRRDFVAMGETVGSMPENAMPVFLDKLGERLAFERTGARLYEAMISHLPAKDTGKLGPSVAELRRVRDQEIGHMEIVQVAIIELGGDPTQVTPCADVAGTEGVGLVQVLADPRTTRAQCLHALLTAELVDNDGWEMLIQLARAAGKDDIAKRFQTALDQERTHLQQVRGWLLAQVQADAQVKVPVPA